MSEYHTLVSLLSSWRQRAEMPQSETNSDSQDTPSAVKFVLTMAEQEKKLLEAHVNGATIRHWAKAIHTVWRDEVTQAHIVNGLKTLNKFTHDEIVQEASQHFLDVVIHIDTESIRQAHNINDNLPCIILNTEPDALQDDIHWQPSIHEEDLTANKRIHWQFVSDNGQDQIMLKSLHLCPLKMSHQLQECARRIDIAPDTDNYVSHADAPEDMAYWFTFTVNNTTQLFSFRPWSEVQQSRQ